MNSNRRLHVDWCSFEAAKHAVTWWHYSGSMPTGKLMKFGVWERGEFIGVVLYGRGVIYRIGDQFGLDQTEVCELVRVALREHETPVTRIVAITLRMLRRACPGLRLVISFADPNHGHHGGIYQAGNWTYLGLPSARNAFMMICGELMHSRSAGSKFGTGSMRWIREHVDPNAHRVEEQSRYKYAMPLDPRMRRQIEVLARPYPRPVAPEA